MTSTETPTIEVGCSLSTRSILRRLRGTQRGRSRTDRHASFVELGPVASRTDRVRRARRNGYRRWSNWCCLTVREAGPMLKMQAKVAGHFVGDRLRSANVDSADDIAAGTGAVLRVGGGRCAVYRDEAGDLHAVSARCTHLGCLVRFNDAELAGSAHAMGRGSR